MKPSRKCTKFTQMSALFVLVTTSATILSLHAIFFPAVAEHKGANAFEYGVVFSIHQFVTLFATPIIGSHIHIFQVKYLISFGMVLDGCVTVLFGLTSEINGLTGFLTCCSILRIFDAIGTSVINIGSCILITTHFPNSIATYIGVVQAAYKIGPGIGSLIGPPLLQFGGFKSPFLCMGGFLILLTLLPLNLFPKEAKSESVGTRSGFAFLRGLTSLPLLLLSLINAMCFAGYLFVLVTLEPRIREFDVTPSEVGLMFLLLSVTSGVSAPLLGVLADRMTSPGLLNLIGLIFLVFSFILIGPSTFLTFKSDLVRIAIGLVLLGFGQGAITASTFLQMLQEAKRSGFEDELSRNGIVSGLVLASISFGGIIGPALGGLVVTRFGLASAIDFFLGIYSLLFLVLAILATQRATVKNSGKLCAIELTEIQIPEGRIGIGSVDISVNGED